ncbi:hypothetical protein [Ferruginibacter sp.]|nr:hypothetical protein [Ferruginibacter sp.]
MIAKILLIAISAAALSSCSTAYKSGQTPDDVYYSPVRVVEERRDNSRDEVRQQPTTADDARIRMQIRDRRWRDLNYDYDYDYSYNYSPYYYSYQSSYNHGYYYNPSYCSRPLYYPKVTNAAPINSTPRMVNLNTYKNYGTAISNNPKTGTGTNWVQPTRQYNNSNNGGSKVGNILREVFTPNQSGSNTNSSNSSSNNNTRTYTPSTTTPSSSGSSGSSSGGSSGGSVARPSRGG